MSFWRWLFVKREGREDVKRILFFGWDQPVLSCFSRCLAGPIFLVVGWDQPVVSCFYGFLAGPDSQRFEKHAAFQGV